MVTAKGCAAGTFKMVAHCVSIDSKINATEAAAAITAVSASLPGQFSRVAPMEAVEEIYTPTFAAGSSARGVAVDGVVVQRGASYLLKSGETSGSNLLDTHWLAGAFDDVERVSGVEDVATRNSTF